MLAEEQSGLIDRLTELGEQAAAGTPIEIVEIELRGSGRARLLRIYIDKPGGVTHSDCETISERMGWLLDEQDAVPGASYTLEVSSPGLERKLSKPRDFERVVGQKIRVSVREPVDGQTHFDGKLARFADGTLEIELSPERVVQIPLERMQKAKLKFEW